MRDWFKNADAMNITFAEWLNLLCVGPRVPICDKTRRHLWCVSAIAGHQSRLL